MRARHAAWGVRLALAEPSRPWAAVARALLERVDHQLPPLGLLVWQPSGRTADLLPPALRRMWEGLRALPPVQQVSDAGLQPGAWFSRVPLWGNPLLRLPDGGSLEQQFTDVAATSISNIPDLLAAQEQVQQCPPREYKTALRQRLLEQTHFSSTMNAPAASWQLWWPRCRQPGWRPPSSPGRSPPARLRPQP